MTVSLRQLRVSADFDASKYVAGMAAKVSADKAGAASSREVGDAITTTDQKAQRLTGVERLSRQFIVGYGEAQRFNAALMNIAKASNVTETSMAQLEALVEGVYRKFGLQADAAQLAAAGYHNVSSAIAAVNSRYEAQAEGARRAAIAVQHLADAQQAQARVNAATGVRSDFNSQARADDIAAYGAELDRLRAKYNPLFAAQRGYLATLEEIRQAHRVGALSATEAADAIQRHKASFANQVLALRGVDPAVRTAAKGTALAAHEVSNLSFQMNDMAMMLASGQSPFTLMMQQGTQVAQIMGKRGLGEIFPALAQGLVSLVTPTTLFLAGITAAGYAAYYLFRSLSPEVEKLDGILARHEANIRRLGPAYDDARARAEGYASASAATINLVNEGELEKAKRLLIEQVDGIISDTRERLRYGFRGFFPAEEFKPFEKLIQSLRESARDGTPEIRAFSDAVTALAKADPNLKPAAIEIQNLAKDALETASRLPEVGKQVDEVAGAFGRMKAEIDRVPSAGVQDYIGTLATDLRAGRITAEEFRTALLNLSGVSPDFSGAIASVSGLAGELERAQRAALGLANTTPRTSRLGTMDRMVEGFRDAFEMWRRFGDDGSKGFDPDKPAKIKTGSTANAYRDLVKSAQDRIDQMRLEAQLVGKTGVEAETLRFELDLLQRAYDKGRRPTEAQIAQLKELASSYAEVARSTAEARATADLHFEREQLSRTRQEKEVYSRIRQLGLDIKSAEGERVAFAIRQNQQIERQRHQYEEIADVVGDTLGDAFTEVFLGGIKSFDDFAEHVASGLARLGEQNLAKLFDFSAEGIWGGGGAANDNRKDPWAGMRDAVEKGAFAGTSSGQAPLVGLFESLGMSGAGAGKAAAGVSAGLGGFGMGYQSQNPAMGALGGALSGAAAGAPFGPIGIAVGALIGGAAGGLGGIFGNSQQKKKDQQQARDSIEQSRSTIDTLIDTGMGRGVGGMEQTFRDFRDEAVKAWQTAWKAGDHALANELVVAIDNFQGILRADFINGFTGTLEALHAGLGGDSPFVQAQQRIRALREEMKGFVEDAAFAGASVGDALAAARSNLLMQLRGVEELSPMQAEMQRLVGTVAGLSSTLVELGLTAEQAGWMVHHNLSLAIAKLRDDYTEGLTRSINELRGNGYLNEIADAQKRYNERLRDAAALGLSAALAQEEYNLAVAKIFESADLGADEIARLTAQFPFLASAVDSALKDIRRSFAETITDFWRSIRLDAGSSILSPTDQLAEAKAAFERAASGALGGDRSAMDGLQGAISTYLEQAKSYFGSAAGYVDAFNSIDSVIRQLRQAGGLTPGFAGGGYTGDMATNRVAGTVHGREFVANAAVTARWRPELEAMHAGTFQRGDGRENFRELGRMVAAATAAQTEALASQLADVRAELRRLADAQRLAAERKPAPGKAA